MDDNSDLVGTVTESPAPKKPRGRPSKKVVLPVAPVAEPETAPDVEAEPDSPVAEPLSAAPSDEDAEPAAVEPAQTQPEADFDVAEPLSAAPSDEGAEPAAAEPVPAALVEGGCQSPYRRAKFRG